MARFFQVGTSSSRITDIKVYFIPLFKKNPAIRFENGIWRGPQIPSPEGDHRLGETLLEVMKQNAQLIGQIDARSGLEDSYGSMADRCVRCASWLHKRGVEAGDVISINTSNHLNSLIPVMSSLMIGSIANPWRDDFNEDALLQIVDTIRPKILFLEKTNAIAIKTLFNRAKIDVTLVCFQQVDGMTSFDEMLCEIDVEEVSNFKCAPVEPSQPAAILFTSGTSGAAPKGVSLSYGTVSESASYTELMVKAPGTILSKLIGLSGLFYSLKAVRTGATMIHGVVPVDAHSIDFIQHYKVQWLAIPIYQVAQVLNYAHLKKVDVSTVKNVYLGGMAVSDKAIEKLSELFSRARVTYSYGATEVGGIISGTVCTLRKPRSCGKLNKNVDLKVVREDGTKITEPCKGGEILVRSPNQMIGYYNNSGATATALDDEGWYRTGDYGYYDEDGDLFIMDRLEDLIRSKAGVVSSTAIEHDIQDHPGVLEVAVVAAPDAAAETPFAFIVKNLSSNIVPPEIEEVILSLRGVAAACVVGAPHPADGARAAAVVRRCAGAAVTAADIERHVASQLSVYKQLHGGVIFVDEMPMMSNGKIDRNKAKAMVLQAERK